MRTIRWGIIGAGSIATKFAEALNYMEYTELTAIASRDITRAKVFADRFQVKKAYGSYEELANDPDIDVVYIATPHTEHKDNAALCITHGKAVLCEKPFTLNQRETQNLIDLASEHNVFLMEAMWTKFLPVTKTVKRWLQDNRIGNIKYLQASFGFEAAFDINSRLFNPMLAGGALMDVGEYPLTYAIHMMDKLPDQVVSSACIGKSGVDEINTIILRYNEGIMAELSSAISVRMSNDAIIIGDKGKIVIPEFWMAQTAKLYNADGELEESFSELFIENGYENEAEEVNTCLRDGRKESRLHPLSKTLEVVKIMDGLRSEWGLKYPQE
jgi:predicted dehydrogenase